MILIKKELFIDLVKYHIGEVRGEEIETRIYRELEEKLNKVVEHENYTKEKKKEKEKEKTKEKEKEREEEREI